MKKGRERREGESEEERALEGERVVITWAPSLSVSLYFG